MAFTYMTGILGELCLLPYELLGEIMPFPTLMHVQCVNMQIVRAKDISFGLQKL